MNVCVVSALPSGLDRAKEVTADLTGRGYRSVLVCLFPMGNRRFQAPGTVIVAPNTFDQRINRFLNANRPKWQVPLSTKTGPGWKVARAVEWRAFRVTRFGLVRTALQGENLILRVRNLFPSDETRRLLNLMPKGPEAYAAIYAADERAEGPAREAAEVGGAAFFSARSRLASDDYEHLNEEWLKV